MIRLRFSPTSNVFGITKHCDYFTLTLNSPIMLFCVPLMKYSIIIGHSHLETFSPPTLLTPHPIHLPLSPHEPSINTQIGMVEQKSFYLTFSIVNIIYLPQIVGLC